MHPNRIEETRLFLGYQSCVQGSLEELDGGYFCIISYILEYINMKHAKFRTDYEMITSSPSLPKGLHECKHSELDENDYDSAVVHNRGLRFCNCNELWEV